MRPTGSPGDAQATVMQSVTATTPSRDEHFVGIRIIHNPAAGVSDTNFPATTAEPTHLRR